MYDFDRVIDRHEKNSAKWDERFIGKEDQELLPFWVADTDFPAPKAVQRALAECVEHNLYGYSLPPAGCAKAAADWQKRRHSFDARPEWAVFMAGIDSALAASVIFIADEKMRHQFEEEKDRCCNNTNLLGLVAMEAAYRDGDTYAAGLCWKRGFPEYLKRC